jgi:hypothetical protein
MKTSPDNAGQDISLIEPAFPLSPWVKGNRDDRINGGVTQEALGPLSHEPAQMSSQGDPPTVLKKKEELPEGIFPFIEDGRTGQQILGRPGSTGLATMRWRMGDGPSPKRSPASRTEGGTENPDSPPAGSTDDGPRSDAKRPLTDCTPGREQEPQEGKIEF